MRKTLGNGPIDASSKETVLATKRGNHEGTVYWYEARKTWVGQIRLKDASGQYKRKYALGKSRKQVQDKMRALRVETEKGLAIGEKKWTTGQWLEEFVRSREKLGKRPKTIKDYRYYVDYYLIPRLGSIPLKELRRPRIQAFVDQLAKEGILAPITIRHCITKLRTALKHAVATGIIETSPAILLDMPYIAKVEKNPYNLEEAKALLQAVIDHRFRALFTLSISTGLREGEALGLRWSDVNLENGSLDVTCTLHRRDGAWFFEPPKTTSSNRTVAMTPLLLQVLAQHRESQTAERLLAGKAWQDYGVVFATHTGGPLLARNVFRDYKKMQGKAGLRKQTYHDLRHACANLLMNSAAASLADVSKILGHSQLSITADFYKHLSLEAQAIPMDKLGAALAS
jgi:integrase